MTKNNKKYKVLFLASWYPSRQNPLSGVYIKRHAEAVARSCDVAVLHVAFSQYPSSEYGIENGIPTVRVFCRTGNSGILNRIRFIYGAYMGYRLIKKNWGLADISHVNIAMPIGLFAYLLKLFASIPYIITEHCSDYYHLKKIGKGFLERFLTRVVIRNARRVTTVSVSLKKAMLQNKLKNDYSIVYNVVDLKQFCLPKISKDNFKKKILHVSTFGLEKNIFGILRVIKKLSQKRMDFELHLIGDGKNRQEIEAFAQSLGIVDNFVYFYGKKSSKDIAKAMQDAHFLVMFSNYESLPCVIIEALASGLPIIATRVGGIPQHITQELGCLVNPHDEKGLLLAIDNLLDDSEKYNRENIRKYAVDNFSYENVGRKFYNIYRKILANA